MKGLHFWQTGLHQIKAQETSLQSSEKKYFLKSQFSAKKLFETWVFGCLPGTSAVCDYKNEKINANFEKVCLSQSPQ